MDTTTSFTSRLQKLLDYYGLSASGLAAKIGVQRSSISHILSGRNKPSLDFVMRLLHTFSELSIEWLVDGKGTFPKTNIPETTSTPIKETATDLFSEKKEEPKKEETSVPEIKNDPVINEIIKNVHQKKIDKIIVLYNDGSFDAYQN